MFTSSYGFIVDYLAEILRHLRSEDFSHLPDKYFSLCAEASTRDRDGIYKTMSGMLKLIFPNGGETESEVEELFRLAIESRKRVKDQLLRIDNTYPAVDFHFTGSDGKKRPVKTVEEDEFPQFYHKSHVDADDTDGDVFKVEASSFENGSERTSSGPSKVAAALPAAGHFDFAENRKGISFDKLFGPYIDGATRIEVVDPYIRIYYQVRNMMEFVEMVVRRKAPEDQVTVHLVTGPDDGNISGQRELLESITEACVGSGVDFTWAFDGTGTAHARSITTDTGWKIVLDRGLDVFQPPIRKPGGFSLGDRLQEHRMAKGFYVTYVHEQ
jgi:ATP-dependent Lon protease